MVSKPILIPDVVQVVSDPIYFQLSHKATLDATLTRRWVGRQTMMTPT